MRYVVALAIAASIGAQPVPHPAKEFVCSDAAGKKIALSSYKGKVVLVQFLSTTCAHCQALSQMLTKLQTEYGPQGFQAVGIAFNEANAGMVKSYAEDHHIGIPVGFAPRDAVLQYLGVSVMDQRLSVPQVVVIDRAGQVRAQSDPQGTRELSDESYLRALIVRLLAGGRK
jgi:peroxiredoxin